MDIRGDSYAYLYTRVLDKIHEEGFDNQLIKNGRNPYTESVFYEKNNDGVTYGARFGGSSKRSPRYIYLAYLRSLKNFDALVQVDTSCLADLLTFLTEKIFDKNGSIEDQTEDLKLDFENDYKAEIRRFRHAHSTKKKLAKKNENTSASYFPISALNIISGFYSTTVDSYMAEKALFNLLKDKIERRMRFNDEQSLKDLVSITGEFFMSQKWMLFEKEEKSIVRRICEFEPFGDDDLSIIDSNGYPGALIDFPIAPDQKTPIGCFFDPLNYTFWFECFTSFVDSNLTCTYDFSYKEQYRYSNNCVGHCVKVDTESGSVNSKICVMIADAKGSMTHTSPRYTVYNFDDPAIHPYARAILLRPTETDAHTSPFMNLSDSILRLQEYGAFLTS
ncbi:MAG: hypothetical protein JSS64_12130 [Bacteroidetes bacterium]|nr:hypothetical protein [Bacteroidota bacterium]